MTLIFEPSNRQSTTAEARIAELEAENARLRAGAVPEHVRAAMAFVGMCQAQALNAVSYFRRGRVGCIHRELLPCEEGAFNSACDSLADYFDANNKSVRAYISKGKRVRRKA